MLFGMLCNELLTQTPALLVSGLELIMPRYAWNSTELDSNF
ncbi:MAG: hypothetical protein ACPIOQ_41740 [Promethearchaeia archaeon]